MYNRVLTIYDIEIYNLLVAGGRTKNTYITKIGMKVQNMCMPILVIFLLAPNYSPWATCMFLRTML